MSLIYKALENAKSQHDDFSATQQTPEQHSVKQSQFRSSALSKWALSVTVLTAGGALMLANAEQFGGGSSVAPAISQAGAIQPMAKPMPTHSDVAAVIDGTKANVPVSKIRDIATQSTQSTQSIQSSRQAKTKVELSAPVTTPVAAPLRQETFVLGKQPMPELQEPVARPVIKTVVSAQSLMLPAEKPGRQLETKPAYGGADTRAQLPPRVVMHTKRPYNVDLYNNDKGEGNTVQQHDSVEHIVLGAKQAIRSKDFATAEIKLHTLGDIAGNDSMVYKRMSAFYLQSKGEKEAAALAYHDIVEMAPNDLEAGYNLALLEVQLGRVEQAKNRIRFLKEAFPQSGAIDKLAESIKN